jgi:hypothetical protein
VTWETAWQLARDILLTGAGLFLIIWQGLSRDPSDVVIVAALTLLVPAAATHAKAVLSGPSSPTPHGPPESLPSSPPAPGLPSSSSPSAQEAAGEAGS